MTGILKKQVDCTWSVTGISMMRERDSLSFKCLILVNGCVQFAFALLWMKLRPPKIYVLNSRCGYIWRKEVIKVKCGYKGGALIP